MPINVEYIKTPSGILKIVEFIFLIIAVCIFRGGNSSFGDVDANFFAIGAMVTGLIITPLLFVCYLMGKMEIQKTILEMALNLLLFIFLLSIGATAIANWSDYINNKAKKLSMTMASFCLMASFAYLGDFVFAVVNFRS